MLNRGNSRGLSKIATIILIVLIIIVIISFFIIKDIILKGSGDRTIGKYTLDLKISQVQIIQNNSLNVMVKRNKGSGEFTGINFILDDGKNTEMITTNISLEELEFKAFSLHFFVINVSKAKKISIDPIFKFESEKNFGENIKDVYFFGSSDLNSVICKPYCPEEAECGSDSCGGECAGGCTENGYSCLENKCIADLETKCLQSNVTITEVNNLGTNFSVTLSRQGGKDNLGGVKLVFTNEIESSNFVTDIPGNIIPYETSTNYVSILESYLANPKKVRTMVYFLDDSGNQELCSPSNYVSF